MTHELRKSNIIEILKTNETISHIRDVESLLDRVLLEARQITNADAGSIYLLKGNQLSFEYVQNDTLMRSDKLSNKYLYVNNEIAINNNSISGYVAANRTPLVIDDVYQLGSDVPYTFNRSFDQSSSYHTQSMLTVPLITSRDKITGVMQIINAKNKNNRIIPFSEEAVTLVSLFANQAAVAIERAKMTREVILRMIKMAELRDSKETGAHVNRVGAYSVEIYQSWATRNNITGQEIRKVREIMKSAAMLHDVGKVAISDSILKKNSKLSNEEFEEMKYHTIYGAQLFKDANSDWDDMAAEIALNHHEKWDGSGYPGYMDDPYQKDACPGSCGKKGEDIPISARIVALADVYDALMSARTYKHSWAESDTLSLIKSEKNKQFDPQIVDAFMDIYDIITAIRAKFPG